MIFVVVVNETVEWATTDEDELDRYIDRKYAQRFQTIKPGVYRGLLGQEIAVKVVRFGKQPRLRLYDPHAQS